MANSKYILVVLFAILIFGLSSCKDERSPKNPTIPVIDLPDSRLPRIKSVDISFLPQIRTADYHFKDEFGAPIEALDYFQTKGVNTIRLRIWYRPENQHSSWLEVKDFANEVHSRGLKLWLTVHYSDSWADPGSQLAPNDWQNLTISEMEDSVFEYTERIMLHIKPEYVQIGNEINPGMLWPLGNRSSDKAFHRLLNSGIKAVRESGRPSKIILHYAGVNGAQQFFNEVDSLDFDIIGLSLYPFWHGKSLVEWESVMDNLVSQFKRPCLIVETAYPFSLLWNDWTNNIVGSTDQLMTEYVPTPQGQLEFMIAMNQLSLDVDSCLGWSYWAPEWVAYDGSESSTGSSWENLSWWDFEGNPLPIFDVLDLQ